MRGTSAKCEPNTFQYLRGGSMGSIPGRCAVCGRFPTPCGTQRENAGNAGERPHAEVCEEMGGNAARVIPPSPAIHTSLALSSSTAAGEGWVLPEDSSVMVPYRPHETSPPTHHPSGPRRCGHTLVLDREGPGANI